MDKTFAEELCERLRDAADKPEMKTVTNFMGELRSHASIIGIAANIIERFGTLPLDDGRLAIATEALEKIAVGEDNGAGTVAAMALAEIESRS